MKYNVYTDNEGYLTGFEHKEDGDYDFDATKMDLEHLNCYKMVDGQPQLDQAKYDLELRCIEDMEVVNNLKHNLASTDYIWFKIEEGDATPEDYADIIVQRKEWRAKIRELEGRKTV